LAAVDPEAAPRYEPDVAKEARKIGRAADRQSALTSDGKAKKKALTKPVLQKAQDLPDPLSKQQLKSLLLRLGIPVLAVWMLGLLIAGISYSTTVHVIALAVPGVVTVLAVGLVLFVVRQAKKARGVANILSKVETAEDRKAALGEL
jgi:Flp pilus assembly protein TadB